MDRVGGRRLHPCRVLVPSWLGAGGIQLSRTRTVALGRTSPPHSGITRRVPLHSAPGSAPGHGGEQWGQRPLGGQARPVSSCFSWR